MIAARVKNGLQAGNNDISKKKGPSTEFVEQPKHVSRLEMIEERRKENMKKEVENAEKIAQSSYKDPDGRVKEL